MIIKNNVNRKILRVTDNFFEKNINTLDINIDTFSSIF